jgi:hypothetical protein
MKNALELLKIPHHHEEMKTHEEEEGKRGSWERTVKKGWEVRGIFRSNYILRASSCVFVRLRGLRGYV